MAQGNPASPKKILVISLAGIGDTLIATPFIHELRANFPEARIDALILWPGSRDLLSGNPHLNHVYQKDFVKEPKLASLKFLHSLRKEKYDISINTHPQSRIHYRIIAALAGAKVRISHRYECVGLFDRMLVNRFLPQDYSKHTIDNNSAILPLLGARTLLPKHEMEIYLSPEEEAWAESFIASKQLATQKKLGVHVGSGGTKNLRFKRWPLKHYLELVKRLNHSRPDISVILFGGPEEQADHAAVMAQAEGGHTIISESRNLRQAAALIKRCDAFLSVDTALMHIAAAMKVPQQIVIEAPTLNATNLPYGNKFTVVRNPAVGGRNLEYYKYDGAGIRGTPEELLKCMDSVTVDEVYKAVTAALP